MKAIIEIANNQDMHRRAVAAARALAAAIGRGDHQMAVEGFRRRATDGADHRRPERDVGHEMAVHHVEMDPICPSRIDGGNLRAEAGEIR